ncbi:MAG: trypsin-like peptidase domain-containing protein [Proteobacteria bacterium]|nr:trypsin-like peptidase domain-containing protein [Pseudomonadota bacterium]
MSKWTAALTSLLVCAMPACLHAEDIVLPKDLTLPTDVSVAIYLPKNIRDFRNPFRSPGGFQTTSAVQLGLSFEELTLSTAQHFFKSSFMYELSGGVPFGLLVTIHPSLKKEDQQIVMTVHYQVYDAGGASLMQRDAVARLAPGSPVRGPDYLGSLSEQALTRALTEIVAELRPKAAKYPSQVGVSVKIDQLIDHEKPVVSGTGFFLNKAGDLLTAAHVVNDCASIEVRSAQGSIPATPKASSALLDLAVLETHAPSEHALSLREHADLGESVVNVGFPLQTLMTDAPTVTRGTLSSRAGLSGSVGQFQFTAPIQPGASGGPVVDLQGNVLGVAVGTLNASELLKTGVLPQNVNFALESRYVTKFLQQHAVAFTDGTESRSSGERPVDDILPAVVSVKCYQ